MSKLPVNSGAECVKALEKIGFVVVPQRKSHIILVREEPKTTQDLRKMPSRCSYFLASLAPWWFVFSLKCVSLNYSYRSFV